jgi:ribosome-binding protein aMBF1 (putative translation factor)
MVTSLQARKKPLVGLDPTAYWLRANHATSCATEAVLFYNRYFVPKFALVTIQPSAVFETFFCYLVVLLSSKRKKKQNGKVPNHFPDFETRVLRKNTSNTKTVGNGSNTETLTFRRKTQNTANTHASGRVSVAKLDDHEAKTYRLPTTSQDFRNALTCARNKAKLKQAQLAAKLNTNAGNIAAYENGTLVPSPHIVSRLNVVLNCKLPKIEKVTIVPDEG